LPSWRNKPEATTKPAKPGHAGLLFFRRLDFFGGRLSPRFYGKRDAAMLSDRADKQQNSSARSKMLFRKITSANPQTPSREGYPCSMSKKKRGCLATYRQSENELLENPFSVGSNVNNL
jgi:hypothetical protein